MLPFDLETPVSKQSTCYFQKYTHRLYQLSSMALAWTLFSVELAWKRPISVLLKPSSYAKTVHSKPSCLEISCSVFRLITASCRQKIKIKKRGGGFHWEKRSSINDQRKSAEESRLDIPPGLCWALSKTPKGQHCALNICLQVWFNDFVQKIKDKRF